ncbi:hypothetical protein AAVH_22284 [Aphelenchoides avenae]|nr:hypothetical protein AAVH_22284 [Aphelenchus avenae]
MLTGVKRIMDQTIEESFLDRVREQLDNAEVSQSFRDFVLRCMAKDPLDRPSACDLLGHAFVQQQSVAAWKALLASAAAAKGKKRKRGD